MAQKKSQVQNFEKAFDYTLFLGKYLPTFKCSSQNSTSVDTLVAVALQLHCSCVAVTICPEALTNKAVFSVLL